MNRYYILTPRGERLGPFDREGLRRRYNAGSFNTTTKVQTEGMDSWVPITRILSADDAVFSGDDLWRDSILATCFPLRFRGRLARRDYWLAMLVLIIVNIAVSVAVGLLGFSTLTSVIGAVLGFLWGLVLLTIGVTITWRRLHDVGRSGWWTLLALTLIGTIVVLIFCALKGEDGSNAYGAPGEN